MSGVAGADRVKSRADFAHFLNDYRQLISQFPGFVDFKPSGSYNSNLEKQDFGDIDLIVHIKSDKDKATVKKELQSFFMRQPDTKIVPFSSAKHAGKRTYNAGELVSVRYHDDELGYSAQIDNIVALDPSEAGFKQEFLDMPAEKQGLVLGLVKIATMETDPQTLFAKVGIKAEPLTEPNQEYEFNLSSVEIQLRKITYKPGTYEQISREVVWSSKSFDDLQKILYQYDLSQDFDGLLTQSKATIKNPRSNNRMQGVFASMITVKSGEVGTAKGQGKLDALNKIQQTFKEGRSIFRALIENNNKKVVFAFGRFQPPTVGHELLINKVKEVAEQQGSDYVIYVSKTQDAKTNPLSIDQKMGFLQKMFPGTNFVAANDSVRTPIEAVKSLNQKYNEIVWVAGADRVPTFNKLLTDYNGKEYQYSNATVVSSGERDPDSEGAEGMSGTKMREAAVADDLELFKQGLPGNLSEQDAMTLMNLIKNGLAKPSKTKTPKENNNMAGGDFSKKAGLGFQTYATQTHAPQGPRLSESMLPKSAFAGTEAPWRHKLGPAAQAKGKQKGPVRRGQLVGSSAQESIDHDVEENLRKWFKEKWVRFGPDGKIKGDCARGDDSEGKPKCLPQSKAHALGKKGRASAAARKRREDPNPERKGSAINVATKKENTVNEEALASDLVRRIQHLLNTKFGANLDIDGVLGPLTKQSIKQFLPAKAKGPAPDPDKTTKVQGAKTKVNELDTATMVNYVPKAGATLKDLSPEKEKRRRASMTTAFNKIIKRPDGGKEIARYRAEKDREQSVDETQLDEKCWDTHKQIGMKKKGNRMVPNCVPKESADEKHQKCPHCGGPMFSEELMNEKKDSCYYKVRSRYKVWPSAYASGALVQCRKKGAKNWGTKSESTIPVNEDTEKIMANLIDRIITNEAISHNK